MGFVVVGEIIAACLWLVQTGEAGDSGVLTPIILFQAPDC